MRLFPVRAFTLMELVLVLAILAALVALAAPRYAGALGNYRHDATLRRLRADVALAQQQARASSAPRSILFDPATNRYQITGQLSPVGLGDEPYCATLLWADFAGSNELQFNGFGHPVRGGTISLKAGGSTLTLSIDGETGEVTEQ